MSDVAIRVENLGKMYRIGGPQERYKTFRDTVVSAAQAPFRRVARLLKGQAAGAADLDETIWALKNVSFEVKRGEVLGIIGRNGAGKTTLLKILSRITEPTEGTADIYGRVGSLLEVGTGFHPELTGRENIYLNGAILGMKKVEIDRKFDEIVAFAEVEKFIDTPVKHYSSGMYLRLAFSVASHLEPEILLVDEVLAVGDVEFQKKCLGKMGDIAQSGRTILFVSHQMDAIESLCDEVFLLESGRITRQGSPAEVVSYYVASLVSNVRMISIGKREDRIGTGEYRVDNIWFTNDLGQLIPVARTGESLNIHLEVNPRIMRTRDLKVACSLVFKDSRGNRLFTLSSKLLGESIALRGKTELRWRIDEVPLPEGEYRCNVFLSQGNSSSVIDWVQDAFILQVAPGDFFGSGKSGIVKGHDRFFVRHALEVRNLEGSLV